MRKEYHVKATDLKAHISESTDHHENQGTAHDGLMAA